MFRHFFTAICVCLLTACSVSQPLEDRSFNKARLDKTLAKIIRQDRVAGLSVMVWHGNEEVYFGAYGLSDREAGHAWSRDTLANIYSMTKPVTGVTLLSLWEEGLFKLDDPLSDYLPEYKHTRVYVSTDDAGHMITEPVHRPITIQDIMRHTGGFGYGWSEAPPDVRMRELNPFSRHKTIAQFSEELARVPLHYQPGTQWKYSASVDIQARLIEVLAGRPFEDMVRERVLDPLNMIETGWFVPADKKHRVSPVYSLGQRGELVRVSDETVYGFWTQKPTQINGGHGLIAPIDDYMRFARMLLAKGTLEGTQILKPETVELMTRDHLPVGLTETDFLRENGQYGFGLNVTVRIAPPESRKEMPGEVGEYNWGGKASTLFWVDPEKDMTVIIYTQKVPFDNALHYDIRKAVYKALEGR